MAFKKSHGHRFASFAQLRCTSAQRCHLHRDPNRPHVREETGQLFRTVLLACCECRPVESSHVASRSVSTHSIAARHTTRRERHKLPVAEKHASLQRVRNLELLEYIESKGLTFFPGPRTGSSVSP